MILGMSLSTFTTVHVVISLVGIASGFLVLLGMLRGRTQHGLTAVFLATTVLTSVTGFLFPVSTLLPSHVVGAISLVVLAIALAALYGRHLVGAWRAIYVVTAIAALYLNVFVGVVQAFQKVGFLQPLAPTQSEPPFVVAQVAVLALFAVLGYLAVRRYHPPVGVPALAAGAPPKKGLLPSRLMLNARAILIAGPTASGKSELAVALAERLGGGVVNADSMQVYRELRILTARPSAEDEACAPHALYGFVSGAEAYSAGRYAVDAAAAIADARQAGRVPIIVGGTGLYFKVLLEGLSPVPPTDPQVRAFWRAQAAELPAPELYVLLSARDPETAARLTPTDPQRIVRALEVLESTGRPLAHWQREPGKPVLDERQAVRLLVLPDRTSQAGRIGTRFDAMVAGGALEEVRKLLALGLSNELPVMRALGVAPLAAHVRGELTQTEAVALAKGDTRRYARRQLTWLRRHMIAWNTLQTEQMQRMIDHSLSFIDD